MSDHLNDYGISNEPIDDFAKRNSYPANCKYPQGLETPRDVNKNPDIPFLPIDDWKDTEDWDQMYAEARALEKHYVPHRHHESHQGWSSLCIHGITSVHTESPHTYGYTEDNCPWRWTDVADVCPTITKFFKEQFDYNKYFRIRIMKLAPGGYVIPHRDTIDVKDSHIGPVNLALNHPEECKFYMDNIGTLPWTAGRAIKLNLYNVHAVVNHSTEDRYHIIVHGHAGNSWPDRLHKNYNNWKKTYE